MSWLDNHSHTITRTGLLGILALFFFACEESIEVTGDLVPDTDNVELRSTRIPLPVKQVSLLDSIAVSNNIDNASNVTDGRVYFGNFSDPEIGDVKATSYLNFILPANFNRGEEIGENYTILSVSLNVVVDYYYGDDLGSSHQVDVLELEEGNAVDSTSRNYTINDRLEQGDTVNTIRNFAIGPNDSTDISSLEIPLDTLVGRKMLENLANEDLTNIEAYNAFRGLSLSTSTRNNIHGMNIAEGSSNLEIIYINESDTFATAFTMDISASSFTSLELDGGSVLPENYQNNLEFDLLDNSKVLLHQMLGVNPKIDISDYFNFIDTLEFLQIQRAELVFGEELQREEDRNARIRPPLTAIPYVYGPNNLFQTAGDQFWAIQRGLSSNGTIAPQDGGTLPTNFVFSERSNALKVDVTFFLQEIFNDEDFWDPQDQLFITSRLLNGNPTAFNESAPLYIGNFDHVLVDKEDVYLNIYYVTYK